jgi:putative DNA primase/helicase
MNAETIATALGGRKAGGAWMTRCPAHDDRKPSLSIRDGDDGRVLARCHAGCEQERVIAALLSRWLWEEMRDAQGRPSGPLGCALDRIAEEERT